MCSDITPLDSFECRELQRTFNTAADLPDGKYKVNVGTPFPSEEGDFYIAMKDGKSTPITKEEFEQC